jgi:flagellin
MVTSILSNVAAYSAQSNISLAANEAAASIARLSSGNRIINASDDVAALATGTSILTKVTALRSALANTSQGTSLLQVADGGLGQIVDILQRQKALAVQAGSGSLTDNNRVLLNQEFQQLSLEVDRIASGTNFNGVNLLNGTLGVKTSLASTDALANEALDVLSTLNNPGGNVIRSDRAIEGFDILTGSSRSNVLAPGNIRITDSGGTTLADGAYLDVSNDVYGQFSKFEFTGVTYGAIGVGSGTLNATLNGVVYSGTVVSSAGNTNVVLGNGDTYLRLSLGPVDLTSEGAQEFTTGNITNLFSTLTITRTSIIGGVDFEGTAMDGAIGLAERGNATIRISESGPIDISNFRYLGSSGTANTNVLAVTINGRDFVATTVRDRIAENAFGTGTLQFKSLSDTEVLSIRIDGEMTAINNIRTSLTDRQRFIDALNIGFGRSGSGLNFTVGTASDDAIRIRYGSATTGSIYGGASLDIADTAAAGEASEVLDRAINRIISMRADVGAFQSRFDFASSAIQSSIESQDSARGSLLDTDIAAESTRFASLQVQLDAGVLVLAQANNLPSTLLSLLDLGTLGSS